MSQYVMPFSASLACYTGRWCISFLCPSFHLSVCPVLAAPCTKLLRGSMQHGQRTLDIFVFYIQKSVRTAEFSIISETHIFRLFF